MPPNEISVTCAGCGYRLQVPMTAIRRNSLYCPQCGKNVPLGDVSSASGGGAAPAKRAAPKRGYRPYKRR